MVRPKMTEEERKARKKAYRENHKEERDAYDRVYQEYHKEERKASHRDYSQRLRREAFASYGGFKCNCPGGCDVTDPKFLSIDHINGGGAKHRKSVGGGGANLYLWLKKNNYPPGFRIQIGRAHV